MGFLRNQFRKVIQWESDNVNDIIYKYPLERKEEIMRKSTLVVREGQKALFIQEGKLADVFGPGTYQLNDIRNLPLLTQLYNWKTLWESPYTGDVYFISTKQFLNMKWGTSNPIMMRDKDYGVVRVRGFGVYSFSVGTPTNALRELIGSMNCFTVRNVDEYFKKIITSTLSNVIAESNIAALDLAASYDDLAEMAKAKVAEEFDKIGIEIKSLVIENLSLPEEVERMLDKRTNVGVMKGAMREYAQMESVEAMKTAAANPGGMSGMGIGIGAGVGMGKMFVDSMSSIGNSQSTAVVEEKGICEDDVAECPNCRAMVPRISKFCPECGKNMIPPKKLCPKCGIEVDKKSKFCPECGARVDEIRCKECGKTLKSGQKFCPDCGTPQE
ncbi:MAG: SPFH domain-containing protein [Clostridia bacterium]|nr:SPFH domain-containing protein [Clostridia bacterium]